MRYALGIDIGGTKVAAGILNDQGDLIQSELVKSDPSGREKMFTQVVKCVELLLSHSSIPMHEIYGIGAGVPGRVDVDKGIAVFQNNLAWRNFPLVERLREALGIEKIIIDNDVYMAAFAEWKEAKLRDDELFVYVTISTGISCSIIQGGKFIRGAGFAGEIGLVPTIDKGEEGRVHRLELAAAGPALQERARKLYKNDFLTTKDIFTKYNDGDTQARKLVDNMISSLAHGIYMINSLLDPHKIIFGGSVAAHNPFLLNLLKEKLDNYLIEEQKHILKNMEVSHLGNEQGMVGAGLKVFYP